MTMANKPILTPAALVVARFSAAGVAKGSRALCRLLSVDKCTVYAWERRGGHIPNGYAGRNMQQEVLAAAKKHKVKLTASEVVSGGVL